MTVLGTGGATKTDEFLEKLQTAFDTPPQFMLQFFLFKFHVQKALFKGPKSGTKFLD